MKHDVCPSCGRQPGRRACPALGRMICAVCCGTKRMVEIRCPETCVYLIGARAHPPAPVQRQQRRDAELVAGMLHELSESQYRILMVLQSAVHRYRGTVLPPLLDVDVAEATGSLAATLETADRGIIYEHRTASLPGQRLSTELKGVLENLRPSVGPRLDRDAATALRRLEAAARNAEAMVGGGRIAYLELVGRLVRQTAATTRPDTAITDREEPRLILP